MNTAARATLVLLVGLLSFALTASAQTRPTTRGAASSPELDAAEAQLKAQGLTRSGVVYLLDVDARIAEQLKPSRQAKKRLDDYARQRGAIEAQIRKIDQQMKQWTAEYQALNERLPRTDGTRAYNEVVAQINVISAKATQAQQLKTQRQAELTRLPAPREDYGALIAELADKLETAERRYGELAKDAQVATALAKLSERGPKFRLGPSPGFTSTLTATRKLRDSMTSSVVKLSMDKGVPHVDVTLNGSVTRSMVLDSGAGVVSLTAEVANRLGLKPGPNDPGIKLIMADGKATEGRLMQLDTVKVGQFVVENVECAILPADIPADVCLLGGSFLQNFIYRMDLAAGQLHLTQISGKPKDVQRAEDAIAGDAAGPSSRPTASSDDAFVDLFPTLKGNVDRKRNGAIVLQTGERIMTARPYKPPVAFKVVAQTDSTNIRFGYAAEHIIFNWELDPTHLRIDGGPIAGRHEPGAGKVPTNTWVEFELAVTREQIIIRVDGAERYRANADFSKINQPLNIFTERGGTILVKSVSVKD